MTKTLTTIVDGVGEVTLVNQGDYYEVSNANGQYLGDIFPCDVEDWDEDEYALSAIVSDAIDDGTLVLPEIEDYED